MSTKNTATLGGATQAVRGYLWNGTFASAAPEQEFIDIQKLSISGAFSFKYPKSDMRILSIQADQATSNYTIALTDTANTTYFSNTYQALVFDPAWLIVPADHTVTITPIANVTKLRLIAVPVAVVDTLILR